MLHKLLKNISLLFIFLFISGSVVFYYELKDFYEKEAYKHIKEHVVLSSAMQKFFSNQQKPEILKLMYDYNISKEYFNPKVLSATYMISHINEDFERTMQGELDKSQDSQFHFMGDNHEKEKNPQMNIHELEFKFASDNPLNKKNLATKYESNILQTFNKEKIESFSETIKKNNREYLVYALPSIPNDALCLQCHGDPNDAPKDLIKQYGTDSGFHEKLGEIRAILVIYSEIDSYGDMMTFYIYIEIAMFFMLLFTYIVVRYFLIQLQAKDTLITRQARFAAMGEMLSMIAHQWRQPLTGMSITTNNLLLDVELNEVDNKRLQDNLEIINKQIAYLSSTIDDFKNFFKPNKQQEDVNLHKLVEESLMVINSTLEKNSIIIKNDVDKTLNVKTLRNDLMQIFLNLVKNAMEAYVENNIENRTIEISTTTVDHSIALHVKDYAGGIPKEIRKKIFEPYFSTKNKNTSTGLGLYMSKMIAEDHLGVLLELNVQNDSTTFTLIIPKEGVLDD